VFDQWSRSILDPMARIISRFRISRVREVRALLPLTFQSGKCQSFAMCPMASMARIISQIHKPSLCLINDPGYPFDQQLRLIHDFAYREFERLGHSFL
jgi:hypothetical protein